MVLSVDLSSTHIVRNYGFEKKILMLNGLPRCILRQTQNFQWKFTKSVLATNSD